MTAEHRVLCLLRAFGLALGLLGYTCAPSSEYGEYPGYSEEEDQEQETPELNTTRAAVNGQLTPSQYIREFVDSVFRGDADSLLDSGEDLRPYNLTNANPGFQQYWPQGEWAVTKAEIEFCNTTSDACSDYYLHLGKVCASDVKDKHVTFDNWCELQDDNCRDGTATVWKTNNEDVNGFTWFTLSKGPVYIFLRMSHTSHVVISPVKGFVDRGDIGQYYVFSFGGDLRGWDQTVVLRRNLTNWKKWTWYEPLYFDWYANRDIYSLFGDRVQPFKVEYNTTGWIRLTVLAAGIWYMDEREITYQMKKEKPFELNFIGVGGGNVTEPSWFYLNAWLPVYRGDCKDDPPTIPTDNPSKIRQKMDIDLYNFAGRMDEFGYNFTRVGG